MTQAVATRTEATEPVLTAELDWRVSREGMGLNLPPLSAEGRSIARAAATGYEPMLRPVKKERIERWLDEMVVGMGGSNRSDAERLAFVDALAATSGDLPVGVWTAKTRAAFARQRGEKANWWPSDGEIDAFLRPIAERLRRTARALARMAEDPPPAPEAPRPEPTDEEREHVAAKVREALAAMGEGVRTRRIEPELPVRRVTLTGRDLWERRNQMRAASGMPLLPRPDTFDGYGETE